MENKHSVWRKSVGWWDVRWGGVLVDEVSKVALSCERVRE